MNPVKEKYKNLHGADIRSAHTTGGSEENLYEHPADMWSDQNLTEKRRSNKQYEEHLQSKSIKKVKEFFANKLRKQEVDL